MASFTNQATLRYHNITTNSNVVSGEILEPLSVTKIAVTPVYSTGNDVTFAVSIVNSGATPLTSLTVTDDLGAYPFGANTLVPFEYREGSLRLFLNGVIAPTPTVMATSPLTLTGVSIPAGGNALLLYEALPTEFAPLSADGSITNTVTVSGDGLSTSATAQETVTPSSSPSLTVTKALSPAIVEENGRLTYTFVIQNFGNTDAEEADNASLTDTFLPILSDLTVTLDSNALAVGTGYTYDEATGVFSTVPGVITVPAATFVQNPDTGVIETVPGSVTLTVVGTV